MTQGTSSLTVVAGRIVPIPSAERPSVTSPLHHEKSPCFQGLSWWRRRESNPGPEAFAWCVYVRSR